MSKGNPSSTSESNAAQSMDLEIVPHLKTTIYFTFAFCIAWAWDLVVYGIAHIRNGVSPLEMQLSFGDQPGPKKLVVVCLEFLLSCVAAAIVTDWLGNDKYKWKKVAITATGFFPAPVFGGKLMAYLGQFTLGTIERALINLGACLFCAILASVVPMKLGSPLSKFGSIVRESMGFGLGIAWNIFLEGLFAPDEMDASHLIGMAGYLALLALITFRVAAQVEHIEGEEPSAIDRLWILLTFAMQTVCAFTLVAFVSALTADGWIGHIENLFILLLFAAIISTLVARIDTNSLVEQESDEDEQNCGLDHLPCILKLLVWVPCLWVCCPWIPLVFLLSGVNGVGIKEKWFNVSNMALGLAASIEASGMITEFTNEVAAGLGFCNEKHCSHPWFFVLLQVGVAAVVTIIMIPLLAAVVPEFLLPPEDDNLIDEAVAPSTVTRRRSPVEFITAIPSDTVSLLSGPSSKYSSV